MVPPSPATACWHREVRVALTLSHPDAKAVVSLTSTAPPYPGLSPSTDSLLDSRRTVCCHLRYPASLMVASLALAPHSLALALWDSVPTWASRAARAGSPQLLPAINHIARSLSSSQEAPGNWRVSLTPRGSKQCRDGKHRAPRRGASFQKQDLGRLGFCLPMGRGFSPPPSLQGAGTKSSACHPQTRAQGQGETFTCK